MAKKYSINLNAMLGAMDIGDGDFYTRLDEDQKKEFSAWLAMRWASSVPGDLETLRRVNSRVNVKFSNLVNHPELQWRLIASCGTGIKRRHEFIPPPKKQKKNKLIEVMGELFPMLSGAELEILVAITPKEEIKILLQDLGLDNKEIKGILPK